MIKKTLLGALCTIPFITPTAVPVNATVVNNNEINQEVITDNEQVQEKESCTVMYVGKDVSTTGKAMMSRCGDTVPLTANLYAKVFNHNELANKTIEGKDGFKWKMPSTTYKYVSTPRNPNMGKGLHWEVSSINEMGVGCSATLSCNSNGDVLQYDPLVKTGLTEDNIAQIVGAVGTTAKQSMQYIANVINQEGNGESNIIMTIDKNEVWLMEMYTGHHYCAVKLPSDKACTMGNEFFLNTLADFADDDIITSPGLLEFAVKNGIAEFEGDVHDLKHLHLYNTFAGEQDPDTKKWIKGGFVDSCHMRTWIGRYRFGRNELTVKHPEWLKYEDCRQPRTGKLDPFFTPDRDLSPNDVISYMRDRFETILDNDQDVNYPYFEANKSKLRYVASEMTYQVHIVQVDPNLPANMAVEEIMCLSNAAYSPFIPINNSITSFVDLYSTQTPEYCYDHSSASSLYKRLNTLAATNRKLYGLPTEAYIHEHELAWQSQYDDIMSQVNGMKFSKVQEALTTFCKTLQAEALLLSDVLFNDLLFHIENTTKGEVPVPTTFKPLVHLEYYSTLYGWKYSRKNNIVTMTDDKGNVLTVDVSYLGKDATCKVKYNNSVEETAIIHSNYGEPFVEYGVVKKYIASNHSVAKININDYISKNNNALWAIVPAVGIVAIIAGVAIPFAVIKRREKKLAAKKQAEQSTSAPANPA